MELAYSLNTLYFLLSGVLVMWMAAGFTMLEAGSVRSKNVIEILLKNVALYSTASLGFLILIWTSSSLIQSLIFSKEGAGKNILKVSISSIIDKLEN